MNTTPQSPGSTTQHRNPAAPEDHLNTLQDDARAALASAREHGTAQFEQYRDTAAQQIETLAHGAQSAAEQLQEDDTFGLSHYVTDIAQNMTTLAGSLRGKSVDELIQQAGRMARDNPALFVTASVALGFGLSRFLKASGNPQSADAPTGTPSDPGGADTSPAATYATRPEVGGNPGLTADQEIPSSPPNTDDVRHSGQPGIPDVQGTAGSGLARDPLAADATYPDGTDNRQPPGAVGLSSDDTTRRPEDRLFKGDVS